MVSNRKRLVPFSLIVALAANLGSFLVVGGRTLVTDVHSDDKAKEPKRRLVNDTGGVIPTAPYSDDLRLAFLHVPKAGGTMLQVLVEACFRQLNVGQTVRCEIGKGNPFDHVCERSEGRIQMTIKNIKSSFLGENVNRDLRAELQKCHFLESHYDFSLVENVLKPAVRLDLQTIVILRNPIARELSAHRFCKSCGKKVFDTRKYLHEQKQIRKKGFNLATNSTRKDLDRQKYGLEHNHMTRQLAGILWRCSQKSKLEQDTLANDPGLLLSTAKANLASMDHVLIYENKESIPYYLRCVFGCLVPVSLPDELYNSRGNKKLDSHVALDVTQEIGAHNALDKELYDFAEQLYKKSRCATYQHKHSVQ